MSQLVACPECKKHLQVPDELMGKKVQCPECKHTFTAAAPDEQKALVTTKTTTTPAPPKISEWDKKSSKSSSSDTKKRKRDDDEYDVGDNDDDDDDGRSRRKRKRRESSRGGNFMPHRGGMILAFGLISLLTGIFVLGIIAWVMGNADMEEIRAGRMDPEGEGMTQAGRIMGMISTILSIVGLVIFCFVFGCFFLLPIMMIGGAAAGAGAGGRPGRPRKF